MLVLAVIVAVVVLVVIPGWLLLFGLGRAADLKAPRPGDTAPVRGPSQGREMVCHAHTLRSRDTMRRRLAKANYN
jgi:hypothetical protein